MSVSISDGPISEAPSLCDRIINQGEGDHKLSLRLKRRVDPRRPNPGTSNSLMWQKTFMAEPPHITPLTQPSLQGYDLPRQLTTLFRGPVLGDWIARECLIRVCLANFLESLRDPSGWFWTSAVVELMANRSQATAPAKITGAKISDECL